MEEKARATTVVFMEARKYRAVRSKNVAIGKKSKNGGNVLF